MPSIKQILEEKKELAYKSRRMKQNYEPTQPQEYLILKGKVDALSSDPVELLSKAEPSGVNVYTYNNKDGNPVEEVSAYIDNNYINNIKYSIQLSIKKRGENILGAYLVGMLSSYETAYQRTLLEFTKSKGNDNDDIYDTAKKIF